MTQPEQIELLKARIRAFAEARDWQQFHTPKNLVMAICGEAGELAAVHQWCDVNPGPYTLNPVVYGLWLDSRDEMADIFIYLIRLADVLNIDLIGAAYDKIEQNEKKYPADKVRGSAKKYTEY